MSFCLRNRRYKLQCYRKSAGTYRQYFVPYDIQAESYFSAFPVGFNDASVLDMIAFKTAHKSVHIFSWRASNLIPFSSICFETSFFCKYPVSANIVPFTTSASFSAILQSAIFA